MLHSFQTLPDVGVDSGVGEGYPPIVDVAVEELKLFTATGKDEVVRHTLVIVQKVILHDVSAVTEAEDKVFVPEMRVVLHDMPQDRAITDLHHRFGYVFRIADAEAKSSAKK